MPRVGKNMDRVSALRKSLQDTEAASIRFKRERDEATAATDCIRGRVDELEQELAAHRGWKRDLEYRISELEALPPKMKCMWCETETTDWPSKRVCDHIYGCEKAPHSTLRARVADIESAMREISASFSNDCESPTDADVLPRHVKTELGKMQEKIEALEAELRTYDQMVTGPIRDAIKGKGPH